MASKAPSARADDITAEVESDVAPAFDSTVSGCETCGCPGHPEPIGTDEHQAHLAEQFAAGQVAPFDLFEVRGALVEAVGGRRRKTWLERGAVITEGQAERIRGLTHPDPIPLLQDVHDTQCQDGEDCEVISHWTQTETGEHELPDPVLFTMAALA